MRALTPSGHSTPHARLARLAGGGSTPPKPHHLLVALECLYSFREAPAEIGLWFTNTGTQTSASPRSTLRLCISMLASLGSGVAFTYQKQDQHFRHDLRQQFAIPVRNGARSKRRPYKHPDIYFADGVFERSPSIQESMVLFQL